MSIETAFQRLRDANPVPEPAALRERRVDPSVFLATTQQRSREMQTERQPLTTSKSPTPPSRKWMAALAAFVVVVLIGGSILLFSGGSSPDVAATTAAPTTPPLVGGTLTMEVLFIEAGLSPSPFTTSGTADICTEGEALNVDFFRNDTLWTWDDEYTCADGSGTFIVSGEFILDPEVPDPATLDGTWTISRGTGAYTELEGSGTNAADFAPLWKETYTGEISYGPPTGG